ncbi:methyltransferase domain-containing protein [Candidatus Dependentiae bacterium]|nr:methyltransferase domain-containing protein [Candidatus Dependentiae bacterium]
MIDIGSGYTIFPLWFIELGYGITIFDLPERKDRLELYKNLPYIKKNINKFNCIYGDIVTYSDFNRQYDFLTCVSVIEHIENDITAFQNIIKLLSKNGIAVLTFPVSGKYIEWRDSNYYLNLSKSFTPQSIRERWIKNNSDVEILNMEYYFYEEYLKVPGNGWTDFANSYNCFRRVEESEIVKHLPVEKITGACEPFFQSTCILTVKKK